MPIRNTPGAPATTDSPRVLIAGASRTGQVLLTQWPDRAGYDVHAVASGDAALEAPASETFDLALVDLDGPGMGGLDAPLLHRFIEPGGNRLPIVGVVVDASAEAERAGSALDACPTRPLDRARLSETVAGFVRARTPTPRPDKAAIGPGVTSIPSHPDFRAGLGPPPADEFDHSVADAGMGGVGPIADASRDEAIAGLDRLAAAASAGDVGGLRARLDSRDSAGAISAARIAALCHSGSTVEAGASPGRGKTSVVQITREVHRVRGRLEGRC